MPLLFAGPRASYASGVDWVLARTRARLRRRRLLRYVERYARIVAMSVLYGGAGTLLLGIFAVTQGGLSTSSFLVAMVCWVLPFAYIFSLEELA